MDILFIKLKWQLAPFEINDLYPSGSSGDLYVTIKGANGSEQHQIVPFASLPVLQRRSFQFIA